VHLHAAAYAKLHRVAELEGKPLAEYLDDVAEREYRRAFFAQLNAAVERIRSDPEAWADYQAENRALEGTLMDGLEPGEDWSVVFDGKTAPW
jgi:hypothetical protein